MTDDDLRKAFAEARGAAPAEPLDPDRIWAAAKGQLSPAETAEVLDRVALDPTAALAWRLARELPDEPAAARVANTTRWFLGGALAVVAAVVVGLGVWSTRPPEVDPGIYRGARGDVPTLAPVHVAPGAPAHLAWTAVPGAQYAVLLLDRELAEVARVDALAAPEATLTADQLRRIGGTGFVTLLVRTADGERRSPPAPVVVGP
jgi:hypothetical protein